MAIRNDKRLRARVLCVDDDLGNESTDGRQSNSRHRRSHAGPRHRVVEAASFVDGAASFESDALVTISPELNQQFGRVVSLAVVTNLVPYVMSMAALITIQNVSGVPRGKALFTNIIAMIATVYSFYALWSSRTEAIMLGGICVFLGWTLSGFVSARFYRREVAAQVANPGLCPAGIDPLRPACGSITA